MSIGDGILKYFPFIFLCVLLTSGVPTQFPHVNPTSPMIPATSTLAPSVRDKCSSFTGCITSRSGQCSMKGSDCSAIQPGGSYDPNTVADHVLLHSTSIIRRIQPLPAVFGGTSQLTNIDPVHNSCRYTLPRTLSSTSSTVIPTPLATRMPAGATIYGLESTAKSSSPTLAPNYSILLAPIATIGIFDISLSQILFLE